VIDRVHDAATWRTLASEHARRAERWTIPHLERRRRGDKHPVMDFLFEYYPYSPGKLRTWHPGIGVELRGDWQPPSGASAYRSTARGWTVDPATVDPARLSLALRILQGTQTRPAQHSCFGMHEWAMVYRIAPAQLRHEQQPLRLSIDEISAAVDEVGLRCTHIDAYRFFTDEAVPLNATVPTRTDQPDVEQPGCLHANMDLFKYAMWFQPYVPGALVLDCFELSAYAREIDMRASPYNVSDLGYPAIAIETQTGRQEYAREQRVIAERAQPLRAQLISTLRAVESAATRVPSA
jgi:hypothetical protein